MLSKSFGRCKLLNVKWWPHIPNKFNQENSKLPGMYDILAQRYLRWIGHLRTDLRTDLKTEDFQNRSCILNLEKGHVKQVDQSLGIGTSRKETWDHENRF